MHTPLMPKSVKQRRNFPLRAVFFFFVCFAVFMWRHLKKRSKVQGVAVSVWSGTDDSILWQAQLDAELRRRHASQSSDLDSPKFGDDSKYRGVRRIKRSDFESMTSDSPVTASYLRSYSPRASPQMRAALPNIDFGPKITKPTGLIDWRELATFRAPIRGERNLFVFWSGSEPGPLVESFFGAIYRNRGGFKMYLITDGNKQKYMKQTVAGKQIAPDLQSGQPLDTHISWDVYRRIMTRSILPIAAQKDFICNVMVAFFGGVYLDPGLIGPLRLDDMWTLMHSKVVNYVNYADGAHRDLKVLHEEAEEIAIDRDGVPKWGGDVWIDVFFTMSFAGSGMMKCWLYFAARDPDFGPLSTQVNRSLYFIYGGDIFDACFAALYDPVESHPLANFPSGANIHLHRDLLPVSQSERRSLGGSTSAIRSPPGPRIDPPDFLGRPPGFSIGGNAIIFDIKEGDPKLWANYIPERRYHELAHPVYPDFKTLLRAKNPTAVMVQFVIDALVGDGTLYLKFYGVGGPLRTLTWEELCGPPISFMMYLQKKVTGFDICRGRDDFDSPWLVGDSQHGGSAFSGTPLTLNSPHSPELPQRPASDQGAHSLETIGDIDLPTRPNSVPNPPRQKFWEFSPIELPPGPSSDRGPERKPRARRVYFDEYTKKK